MSLEGVPLHLLLFINAHNDLSILSTNLLPVIKSYFVVVFKKTELSNPWDGFLDQKKLGNKKISFQITLLKMHVVAGCS